VHHEKVNAIFIEYGLERFFKIIFTIE